MKLLVWVLIMAHCQKLLVGRQGRLEIVKFVENDGAHKPVSGEVLAQLMSPLEGREGRLEIFREIENAAQFVPGMSFLGPSESPPRPTEETLFRAVD